MEKIDFRLILVTDRKFLKHLSLDKFIERCCNNGIRAIQLREKDLSANEILHLAKKLRKVTKKFQSKLIINDGLDIGLLSKADGVHSPENGVPSTFIKKFNDKFISGKSVHSSGSAIKAEKDGYDYIICGPIFKTSSKLKYGKPLGLKLLNEICLDVNIPVFAIGGINPGRAIKCIENGAYGVGVIGAIFKSTNLRKTINDFKNSLRKL